MNVIDDMAAIPASLFPGRTGVYASAPITSGRRLFELRKDHPEQLENPQALNELVIRPNLESASRFAERLRKKYGARVLDPSKLPILKGWSQKHYYRLWGDVVRLYTGLAVFLDGWEYSSGCTYEYIVAITCGIPACNSALNPLQKEDGQRLMKEARDTLAKQGQNAPFLTKRLEQLSELKFRYIDIPEPVTAPALRPQLCAQMIGCVIEGRIATMVFSPLVDGRLLTSAPRPEWSTKDGIHPTLPILERNCACHKRLVESVRENSRAPLIDPAPFAPNWEPAELQGLWERVIATYVKRLILGDDWQYSENCLSALRSALQTNVEIIDHRWQMITPDRAVELVRQAADYAEQSGNDRGRIHAIVEDIINRRNVA